MKIILTKDVQSLGESGDIVNVADGYARNYLIPTNVAVLATDGALKNRERNIVRIKAKAEKLHSDALEKAEKIKALGQIELPVKAGVSGKLFGSITTKKLSEELKEKSSIEIDRKIISLDRPINQVGEYKMLIKLTSKVSFDLPVIIKASEVIQEQIIEEEVTEETAE